MDDDLKYFLEKNKIKYEIYSHKATHTVAESLNDKEIERIPGTRCKTLFLKDNLGEFYLVGLEGVKRLDIRALERKIGVKNLSFASVEEMKREIGVTPGNVSILSALRNERIIIIFDSSLKLKEKVGFHPSNNTETCVFKINEIEKCLNALKNKKMVISL